MNLAQQFQQVIAKGAQPPSAAPSPLPSFGASAPAPSFASPPPSFAAAAPMFGAQPAHSLPQLTQAPPCFAAGPSFAGAGPPFMPPSAAAGASTPAAAMAAAVPAGGAPAMFAEPPPGYTAQGAKRTDTGGFAKKFLPWALLGGAAIAGGLYLFTRAKKQQREKRANADDAHNKNLAALRARPLEDPLLDPFARSGGGGGAGRRRPASRQGPTREPAQPQQQPAMPQPRQQPAPMPPQRPQWPPAGGLPPPPAHPHAPPAEWLAPEQMPPFAQQPPAGYPPRHGYAGEPYSSAPPTVRTHHAGPPPPPQYAQHGTAPLPPPSAHAPMMPAAPPPEHLRPVYPLTAAAPAPEAAMAHVAPRMDQSTFEESPRAGGPTVAYPTGAQLPPDLDERMAAMHARPV